MNQGMFTAMSGILSQQKKLDVISNNVANVNTTSFKHSRVEFASIYDTTLRGGLGPIGGRGGSDPRQVGHGVKVGAISPDWGQGSTQFTGRNTDLSIQGRGFFILEDGVIESGTTNTFHVSRAGNFSLDSWGNLVDSSGQRVRGTAALEGDAAGTMGWIKVPLRLQIAKELDANSNVLNVFYAAPGMDEAAILAESGFANANIVTAEMRGFSIGSDGAISVNYSNGDTITVRTDSGSPGFREIVHLPYEGGSYGAYTFRNNDNPYGGMVSQSSANPVFDGSIAGSSPNAMRGMQLQVQTVSVVNPSGLTYERGNLYLEGANAGEYFFGIPNTDTRGGLLAGALEGSNVDMAGEFSEMILAQRSIEAASKAIRAESEMLQTILQAKS